MRAARDFHAQRDGFTLLEMLLAITILVVITSVVYALFASVTRTVEASRLGAEELRLRQFLTKSFERNLSTVFADPANNQESLSFAGKSDISDEGPMDSLRICSTAPLMGGMALPGDLKEVTYEVVKNDSTEMELSWEDADKIKDAPAVLRVTETPLIAGNVTGLDESMREFQPAENFEPPTWYVPIRTLDILYFDGKEWKEEWDSQEQGRMPWAVKVSINFAKTEDQLRRDEGLGFTVIDDPDFELVIPIPLGVGVTESHVGQDNGTDEEGDNGNGQDNREEQNNQGGDNPASGGTGSRDSTQYIPNDGRQTSDAGDFMHYFSYHGIRRIA